MTEAVAYISASIVGRVELLAFVVDKGVENTGVPLLCMRDASGEDDRS